MASPQLDYLVLPPTIKTAAALRDTRSAHAIHDTVLRRGLLHRPSPIIANTLLTAYTRCDNLATALAVFNSISNSAHDTRDALGVVHLSSYAGTSPPTR
uniref:Pentatricopeptide repeat-containing protein n=1 Tax=Oryza punctata TaxID=4537 RepID=A0A0E0KMA0_ORYPU